MARRSISFHKLIEGVHASVKGAQRYCNQLYGLNSEGNASCKAGIAAVDVEARDTFKKAYSKSSSWLKKQGYDGSSSRLPLSRIRESAETMLPSVFRREGRFTEPRFDEEVPHHVPRSYMRDMDLDELMREI